MREPKDRTIEVKAFVGRLEVWSKDFCDVFEQDAGRLFRCHECWYCRYADFQLSELEPLKMGICYYPEMRRK